MTLQRGSIFGMVLLKKRVTDQEVRPVGQRRSRARAERRVWIDSAGPRTGPCLAETVQRGSRERFLVLFGNG